MYSYYNDIVLFPLSRWYFKAFHSIPEYYALSLYVGFGFACSRSMSVPDHTQSHRHTLLDNHYTYYI